MSPVIYNAAFEQAEIDAVFVAMPVSAGQASSAVQAMRSLSLMGLSVTMPHKADVMAACDELSDRARRLQAVNCVHWGSADLIVGDNTDGAGFVGGLQAELGLDPSGLRCCVLGAGGAARAVVLALAEAGAHQVTVINRSTDRAAEAAALAGHAGAVGSLEDLATADLVVHGTPIGMAGTEHVDALPFDPALLQAHAVVSDLIYHPLETALMVACRARGLRVQNGVSMLVHQAVVQYEHFTGQPAPLAAMSAAAEAAVAAKAAPTSSP